MADSVDDLNVETPDEIMADTGTPPPTPASPPDSDTFESLGLTFEQAIYEEIYPHIHKHRMDEVRRYLNPAQVTVAFGRGGRSSNNGNSGFVLARGERATDLPYYAIGLVRLLMQQGGARNQFQAEQIASEELTKFANWKSRN